MKINIAVVSGLVYLFVQLGTRLRSTNMYKIGLDNGQKLEIMTVITTLRIGAKIFASFINASTDYSEACLMISVCQPSHVIN